MARNRRIETVARPFRTSRSETIRLPFNGPCWGHTPMEALPIWVTKSEEPFTWPIPPPETIHSIPQNNIHPIISQLSLHASSPSSRCVCLTLIALFVIPYSADWDCVAHHYNRWSYAQHAYDIGLMVLIAIQSEGILHFRLECPEITGRTRFHIIAIGRSPPRLSIAA